MKPVIIISFLLLAQLCHSQTFLADYKAFNYNEIKANKNADSLYIAGTGKTAKRSKGEIKHVKTGWFAQADKEILQFDTIFKAYYTKTGFDFNAADSLTIVYQTSIETALSRFIIISGKDTISYAEDWEENTNIHKKLVIYRPFLNVSNHPGYIIFDEMDSLLTLVAKHDFNTALRFAKEHPVTDGATTTVLVAKKENGHYAFETLFLQPFGILPAWRKK